MIYGDRVILGFIIFNMPHVKPSRSTHAAVKQIINCL